MEAVRPFHYLVLFMLALTLWASLWAIRYEEGYTSRVKAYVLAFGPFAALLLLLWS